MSEILKTEAEQTFIIDNDQKAEWALRKIAEARNDAQKWIDYYTRQIETIKAQTAEDTANLESMLYAYFQSVPHKKTKTQESYPLPGGTLVFKKQTPEFKREDDKVIEWLKKSGGTQFVKVAESLDWAGLKKTVTVLDENVVTEDGEVVPGITVIEREPKFAVEVK